MSNIISSGNLTVSSNAVINSDSTKTTIINGLTTINNNLLVNGNITCDDITSSSGNLSTNNINNSDTINTKFLQLSTNNYLNSLNNSTINLYAINSIYFYINNVQKFLLNATSMTTPSINASYATITNITSTIITNMNKITSNIFELYNNVIYITSDNINKLFIYSPSVISMKINNVEKLLVNSDGITTNNIVCDTVLSYNDITTNGNSKSYGFYLNYTNLDKPNYAVNNIGYIYTQSYPLTFINNNNVYNCYNKLLDTGNWMIIINFKISQYYNIENSIYYFCLARNNTDYKLFGLSSTQFFDKLIVNEYYSTPNVFYINIEGNTGEYYYTNFKIISNNYTSLSVQAETKYIRIG